MANDFSESAAGEIFAGHCDHLPALLPQPCDLDRSGDNNLGSSSAGSDDCHLSEHDTDVTVPHATVKSETCLSDVLEDEPPQGFMESLVSDSSYCDLVSSLGALEEVKAACDLNEPLILDQFIDL